MAKSQNCGRRKAEGREGRRQRKLDVEVKDLETEEVVDDAVAMGPDNQLYAITVASIR